MAEYSLTASAADSLVGGANVANVFFLDAAGHLLGTDTVAGGGGTAVDRLVLGATMTLTAGSFANVGGIERLQFNAGGGSSVTLADAMVASASSPGFVVVGGAGDDVLIGGGVASKALQASGAGGNDRLEGGGLADRLAGGTGDDTLRGAAGNDTLSGGAGNDTLDGGVGDDRLDGGAGDDVYQFAAGAFTATDLVADEAGSADLMQFAGALAVNFNSTLGARVTGIERLQFGSGNDSFAPGAAFADGLDTDAATVEGGAGNDRLDVGSVAALTTVAFRLEGGSGADTLIGGRGNDTLDAGIGLGTMSGGSGNDLLLVRAVDLNGAVAIDGGASTLGGDVLRIVGPGSIAASALANVTAIERVELDAGGNEIAVPDSLAASTSGASTDLAVFGSDEDDLVVTTGLAAGRDIVVVLGAGDDTFAGGAGDDTVLAGGGIDTIQLGTGADRASFDAGQLGALDTVAADNLAGDRLDVTLAIGRTLAASAFAGVTGFDTLAFSAGDAGATSGVRLASNLVAQSGQSTVAVVVTGNGGAALVDGRAAAGTWSLTGAGGSDTLWGGSGVNTLSGGVGEDTVVGGDGGDLISLSGTSDRDVALITAITDGTIDINGTLSAGSLAGADRVTGLTSQGNYIGVDWQALGLGTATLFLDAGDDIELGRGANVLQTTHEIAGNAFGSLTAVRNAVGARLTGGTVGVDDKTILVIGGADESQFGVYYFEDRDDNATVDVADLLMLLAIGNGDVPTSGSGRGFTLTSLDFG